MNPSRRRWLSYLVALAGCAALGVRAWWLVAGLAGCYGALRWPWWRARFNFWRFRRNRDRYWRDKAVAYQQRLTTIRAAFERRRLEALADDLRRRYRASGPQAAAPLGWLRVLAVDGPASDAWAGLARASLLAGDGETALQAAAEAVRTGHLTFATLVELAEILVRRQPPGSAVLAELVGAVARAETLGPEELGWVYQRLTERRAGPVLQVLLLGELFARIPDVEERLRTVERELGRCPLEPPVDLRRALLGWRLAEGVVIPARWPQADDWRELLPRSCRRLFDLPTPMDRRVAAVGSPWLEVMPWVIADEPRQAVVEWVERLWPRERRTPELLLEAAEAAGQGPAQERVALLETIAAVVLEEPEAATPALAERLETVARGLSGADQPTRALTAAALVWQTLDANRARCLTEARHAVENRSDSGLPWVLAELRARLVATGGPAWVAPEPRGNRLGGFHRTGLTALACLLGSSEPQLRERAATLEPPDEWLRPYLEFGRQRDLAGLVNYWPDLPWYREALNPFALSGEYVSLLLASVVAFQAEAGDEELLERLLSSASPPGAMARLVCAVRLQELAPRASPRWLDELRGLLTEQDPVPDIIWLPVALARPLATPEAVPLAELERLLAQTCGLRLRRDMLGLAEENPAHVVREAVQQAWSGLLDHLIAARAELLCRRWEETYRATAGPWLEVRLAALRSPREPAP